MNRILLFLFLPLFICCNKKEEKPPTILFAGEIVNPTSKYVVLFKDDVVIDSAKLDQDNRFSFRLKKVDEGLHHFSHSPELQYVYLEKNDSLWVRLNTIDFDESLVFSGAGETLNNFLINMFLIHEEEEMLVKNSYTELEPDEFSEKIKVLRNEKIRLLNNLHKEANFTEGAYAMAKASIDYNSYIYKELYPFYHKRRKGEDVIHTIDNDFYKYREYLDYDNEHLAYLRPYYNFMKWHFDNLSYMDCKEKCAAYGNKVMNKFHFNKHKLQFIDSLAKGKELRDNLFRNVAVDFLIKSHDDQENCAAFIKEFHKYSKNNKHISEIDNLYADIRNIQPDNAVPDLHVQDVEGNNISLKDISKEKEVVFYFWSGTNRIHFNKAKERVAKLSKEHPELNFVGINLRTDEQRWKNVLNANQLDKNLQFRAKNYQELERALVIVYDRDKTVITKNGKIVDAFGNLYKSF